MLGRRRQTHKSACVCVECLLVFFEKAAGALLPAQLLPSMDNYEKRATRCWTALLHVERSVWCVWFVVLLRWCWLC